MEELCAARLDKAGTDAHLSLAGIHLMPAFFSPLHHTCTMPVSVWHRSNNDIVNQFLRESQHIGGSCSRLRSHSCKFSRANYEKIQKQRLCRFVTLSCARTVCFNSSNMFP